MEDNCIHEWPRSTCGFCKPTPKGINKVVYITAAGWSFHNDAKCETLEKWQEDAQQKGMNIHPINPVAWGVAINDRSPCRSCCPDYYKS